MPQWFPAPPRLMNEADTYRVEGAEVVSPDGTAVAAVEVAQEPAPEHRRTTQILMKRRGSNETPFKTVVPPVRPRLLQHTILGWSADSKDLYYLSIGPQTSTINTVDTDGKITKIFEDESALIMFPGSVAASGDMKTAVFVRSSNVIPADVVAIDLRSGKLTILARPNAILEAKAAPQIRFMRIGTSADDFGRLYLPSDHRPGTRYPLVITHYYSYPGFIQVSGDEVPIHSLVAHGIAVLAMHSTSYNMGSTFGRFEFQVNRVARPLEVMEWAIKKLASEGVIDPDRVGVTGLSFGTEISMYAYWKSKAFRAISTHGSSVSQTGYLAGGPNRVKDLRFRGFPPAGDPRWKELSAGLNARPDLPPLLWHVPETEMFNVIETWTRLREAGAQMEWWHYPNEGHVKRQPAHKWWVYQRNLDWFRFWLKDEEDPDPTKKEQYARWRDMREKWEVAKRGQEKTVQIK
jgi:dipeptidyl aminopeptidase/acylaminoacyl peptidase